MGRRAILLLILVAACRVGGVTQLESGINPATELPSSFRLLCWNVHKCGDPDLEGDLIVAVEGPKPDLLLLQEVRPDRLPERLPGGAFAPSWRYPWPGGRVVGVATLSRAPVLDPVPLRTSTREFGVTAPKTSIATRHALAGGAVLLAVNVHLLAFEGGKLTGFRRQLAAIGEVLGAHSGPVLLAGDFNTWSPERLAAVHALTGAHDLIEVEAFAGGRTTADKGSDFWNALFGITPTLSLDRVFVRGLEVRSARVLEYDSSDHEPLLVDLRAPVPEGGGGRGGG